MSSDPRRLAALVSAQEAIAAAGLDVDGVLAATASHARALTGAAAATVELLDEHGAMARTASDGPVADAQAALCAPVRAGGRLLAVVTVDAQAPRAFDGEDEEALCALARFAAHPLTVAGRLAHAERASRTDALTGLGNRRSFDEALGVELARHVRYGRGLAVCVADLDGFKSVNDVHGHQAGDRVLVQVAGLLGEVRGTDAAFRLGGDEFALLLPETRRDAAELVARRLVRRMREATAPHRVGASWGIAEASGPDVAALLAAADEELYARKRAGRPPETEAIG